MPHLVCRGVIAALLFIKGLNSKSQAHSTYLSSAHASYQPPRWVSVTTYSVFFPLMHFAFTGELKVISHFAGSELLMGHSNLIPFEQFHSAGGGI